MSVLNRPDDLDHDPAVSARMRAVRGKDTKPEIIVRRLVHGLGYRFRLHHRGLPGTPDLVFLGRRKVLFVHGCFWHQHPGCKRATQPTKRADYWRERLARNVARDARVISELQALGWQVATVWECETAARSLNETRSRIQSFLS